MRRFKPRGIDALYGISAEIIAELCGIHITTARRWKQRNVSNDSKKSPKLWEGLSPNDLYCAWLNRNGPKTMLILSPMIEQNQTAIHEAGHAVASYRVCGDDRYG